MQFARGEIASGRLPEQDEWEQTQEPPQPLVERLDQHRADPSHRGHGETRVELRRDQAVDLGRSQLDGPLATDGQHKVVDRHAPAIVCRARGDLVPKYVVVPALEELGDGHLGVGHAEAAVELALEHLQSPEDSGSRGCPHGLATWSTSGVPTDSQRTEPQAEERR